MHVRKRKETLIQIIHNAGLVIKDSVNVSKKHPQIFAYPYLALLFFSATYSFISATFFADWYSRAFHAASYVAPHRTAAIFGIVSFSVFYTFLITAYFTCATSASVLAEMEGRPRAFFHSIGLMGRHFGRVSLFAFVAIFFFPIGIYIQRYRLRKDFITVMGKSLSLHMSLIAPAILTTNKSFGDTIRDSLDTLGTAWRENLVIKVWMYVIIFIIAVAPKMLQHTWNTSNTASNISWLISAELAASSYVLFKVIGAIFTSVLYYKAKHHQIKNT